MWSPVGQQVMIPTPGQPTKRYGIGAVNYHTGETLVLIRRRKRRQEIAELLEALVSTVTGKVQVERLEPRHDSFYGNSYTSS